MNGVTTPETAAKRSTITTVVALALAALYVAACWFLLQKFAMENPLPDLSWQRALLIFNGIASVGFAAIGVLLGTSVQQISVTAARQEAATAKADADKKAEAIKRAIETLVTPSAAKPADIGGGPSNEAMRIGEAHRLLLEGLK